jgi:hypothetical protein
VLILNKFIRDYFSELNLNKRIGNYNRWQWRTLLNNNDFVFMIDVPTLFARENEYDWNERSISSTEWLTNGTIAQFLSSRFYLTNASEGKLFE